MIKENSKNKKMEKLVKFMLRIQVAIIILLLLLMLMGVPKWIKVGMMGRYPRKC